MPYYPAPSTTGGASITQVEVDFGPTPISEAIFIISDSNATSSSRIKGSLAYDAPTGKDLDEVEMDNLAIDCGNASTGQFEMHICSEDGSYLHDKFKINYIIT